MLSLWVSNQGWTAPREPCTAQNTCDWQPTRKYKIYIFNLVLLWRISKYHRTDKQSWLVHLITSVSRFTEHLPPFSERIRGEILSGFLIASVTSDDLLLSCSRNFPRTSILLQKCWKVMGLPWLLLNDIYCKVTIRSKGICADWLWAIAGQSENQVLDGSENSCSDVGQ